MSYSEAEIFENRMKWASDMKGRRKTTGKLTRLLTCETNPRIQLEADCCLGSACKSLGVKRIPVTNYFAYDGCTGALPDVARFQLEITMDAELTSEGVLMAYSLAKPMQRYSDLVSYNDFVYNRDETLDRMKQLIDWLLIMEYLFGIQMFKRMDDAQRARGNASFD